MKFKTLLNLSEATVELDTVDFDNLLFQEYLKRNDIKTKVINAKGPAGGFPVIQYTGAKRAVEMMIHRFFGDDDLKDLIEEGLDPEEKLIRTYKKGNDTAKLMKQEDNSILIKYNLTGHKSGAGLKQEFRTANDATHWLESNGWKLDELHEAFKAVKKDGAKLTKITVDVPTVFGADWRKTHKSIANLVKLAEVFTDEQDMVTIEGYPEAKGNKIEFPVYTDVAPDKKAVDKFVKAFVKWANKGKLTEATDTVQRKRRLAAVTNAHNKMIKDGFIYVKSRGSSGPMDDEIVTHYYVSKDGKTEKTISYSAYGVGYKDGPKITIETSKQGKIHPHLIENLSEEEQDQSDSERERVKQDIEDLRELQEEMMDTLEQMEQILRKYRKEGLYKRAEAYWLAHAKMALTNEHGYLGKNQVSLQDTIEELEEMLEDEEE